MSSCQIVIRVAEASQVGEARRAAARMAEERSALADTERGQLAIVITELSTNLARHATGGEILLRTVDSQRGLGIEVLSIDRGPGMANISRCMEDGYSTNGTAGNGLGAIRRLSTDFDVFSSQPQGTVIVSRVLPAARDWAPPPLDPGLRWGVVCVPAPYETECGDSWSIAQRDGMCVLAMADGLGHGPLAAKASSEAIRVFDANPFDTPAALFGKVDGPLRTTRGAAMAVAQIDMGRGTVRFAGVGNIAGTIVHLGDTQGLCSHNGTVGLQMPRVKEFEYKWPAGALIVLHSDGLQTRWDLQKYAGVSNRHPSLIAGVLYRDFLRGRDDVTVLVAR
jgi:anti-sigma regulatory factor (Ser/Thr protein kinase)